MFPFPSRNKMSEVPEATPAPAKTPEVHPLDALTGGAFSAPTSGERASRVREWLAGNPAPEQVQEVFKELSVRDKGAAKPLRERLDEIKRAKGQEAIAAEWADKAQALLAMSKLNIADALAWQRDAARAGAPLSREPLAALKTQLAERVKVIEDLQHRVQVQREAAVLLAQRTEILSTKPLGDAQAAVDALQADVQHWQDQATALSGDSNWVSVEAKFPPLLDASRAQLLVVWDAFRAALAQATAAAADPAAPLPPVQVWADEVRLARGIPAAEVAAAAARPAKAKVDPEVRDKAIAAVRQALAKLEEETAQGHGKASMGAAAALRAVLKDNGKFLDTGLEHQVHAALVAAGELEGWQRWSADQVREDLVARAEALLKRPDGQALGGRKMQESLRQLRELWKQADQGGAPNHALWKRFDEACNGAHKVVEAWLDKIKAEAAEHKAQRLALIEELKAWGAEHQASTDWKAINRSLHQFSDRWRDAGHLGEKAFAELQPLWKQAIADAAAALDAAKKTSLDLRHAMIDESRVLGEAAMLRIDAVKALQQRWQAEAQAVPLERKHEQKLWDAFRKPIDEAFNRKTAEREKTASAVSERDRVVLDAAKALDAANASGDAQQIRAAMAALDAALRGQAAAQTVAAPAVVEESKQNQPLAQDGPAQDAPESEANTTDAAAPEVAAAAAPAAPRKPVVAMRGDDRPGMKKAEPAAPGRGGKFGDRKDGPRGAGRPGDNKFEPRRDERGPRDAGRDNGRYGDRAMEDRGPRLGDAAFRAQREALEHAQATLRKLAAQAHGEVITDLLGAWEKRNAEQLPPVQALGQGVNSTARSAWAQAIAAAPRHDDKTTAEALLRLEMAADLPTPAEHLSARRMLQLQLLTKRNDPSPAQTWTQDAAKVWASDFDAGNARRLQGVLKVLMKR